MIKITNNIFISNEAEALKESLLILHNIQSVIHIIDPNPHENVYTKYSKLYNKLGVQDYFIYSKKNDIVKKPELDKFSSMLHKWKDTNVLVHCNTGRNRSPSFILYYLVKYLNMDIESTIYLIKRNGGLITNDKVIGSIKYYLR